MDHSLIPRPFSPMDGLRAEEANAREMERRTSARNAQTSSIGPGGKLELAGGIEVEDGGNIDVLDGGVITVLGKAFTDAGVPYEVFSRLSTYKNEGNYGTYSSPGIAFGSSIFPDEAGEGARLFSRSGRDVWVEGGDPEFSQATVIVEGGVFAASYSRDPVLGPFDERASRLNLFPDDGFFLSFSDSLASTFARVRSAVGGFLKLESSSPAGASSVQMQNGDVALAGTGALTWNGQPIGAAPAWADITGKPSSYPPEAHEHTIAQVNGLQVALDGKGGKTESSFYIATGSKGNFDVGNQAISTPSYQGAGSTKNLGTPGGGQIALTDAGVYSVVASVALFADAAYTTIKPATGRSFVDISDGSGNAYSRTPIPVGEDQTTGNHSGQWLPAGSIIKFGLLQTTGGTAFYRARIWITKQP